MMGSGTKKCTWPKQTKERNLKRRGKESPQKSLRRGKITLSQQQKSFSAGKPVEGDEGSVPLEGNGKRRGWRKTVRKSSATLDGSPWRNWSTGKEIRRIQ